MYILLLTVSLLLLRLDILLFHDKLMPRFGLLCGSRLRWIFVRESGKKIRKSYLFCEADLHAFFEITQNRKMVILLMVFEQMSMVINKFVCNKNWMVFQLHTPFTTQVHAYRLHYLNLLFYHWTNWLEVSWFHFLLYIGNYLIYYF